MGLAFTISICVISFYHPVSEGWVYVGSATSVHRCSSAQNVVFVKTELPVMQRGPLAPVTTRPLWSTDIMQRIYFLQDRMYIMSGALWLDHTSRPARGLWSTHADLFHPLSALHLPTPSSAHSTTWTYIMWCVCIQRQCFWRLATIWHMFRNCLHEYETDRLFCVHCVTLLLHVCLLI